MRDLSIQYGIPQSTLSDQFKQIREKYLGLAGEAAFEKKLLREGYKNYEMLGGYSHQPDVILHQDRKVISLKHYCNPKAHVPIEEIAASEIQYALEHSYDLEVWLYNLVDQTWKIYKVTLSTQQPSRSTPTAKPANHQPTLTTTSHKPNQQPSHHEKTGERLTVAGNRVASLAKV